MLLEHIAKVAHEANRAYCATLGDMSQLPWDEAPDWQRKSRIRGVTFHLAHPYASPNHSHEKWMTDKAREGWVFGPEKNPENKTHPCMVPYDELPPEQRVKDYLFMHVVNAFRSVYAGLGGLAESAQGSPEEKPDAAR